jgi:hypothetical protein
MAVRDKTRDIRALCARAWDQTWNFQETHTDERKPLRHAVPQIGSFSGRAAWLCSTGELRAWTSRFGVTYDPIFFRPRITRGKGKTWIGVCF